MGPFISHAFTLTSSAVTPSAVGSNPPPALGRTVNAARIPASFSFLGGVGTMGAIICCHGAQRSGSYQSISYQSRSREEPMKEILPHWHFSPNAPVKDVDTKG